MLSYAVHFFLLLLSSGLHVGYEVGSIFRIMVVGILLLGLGRSAASRQLGV